MKHNMKHNIKKIQTKPSKIFSAILAAAILSCCFGGCGDNNTNNNTNNTVSTDGSTSMEMVIGSLGEAFSMNNPDITFTYNPTGSGSGIRAVKEGRCDIGLSSRNLKDIEKSTGLTETVLAYDGIAVITNPENPISALTSAQLTAIYTAQITTWKEVGGNNSPIVLIGREAGSGTRDGFEAAINARDSCQYRQELTSTGDIITSVSGNPAAIGYASLASVREGVKILAIDGVMPSDDTIKTGSYALRCPFILITAPPLAPPAQKFLDYATSEAACDIITAAGAVPAN